MRRKFDIRPCSVEETRPESPFNPENQARIPPAIPAAREKAKSLRFKSQLLPSPAHSQKPRLIYLVFYKSAHLA